MLQLAGISASPGVALGKALVFLEEKLTVPRYDVPAEGLAAESARFASALESAAEEVRGFAQGRDAGLFSAQLLFFEDPELKSRVQAALREAGKNVEWTLFTIVEEIAGKLASSPDPYLRERTIDFRDAGNRIMNALLARKKARLADIREEVILVTHDLMPSDTLGLDRRFVLGIAADAGGRTSHTAILARSHEIPAVLGLREVSRRVRNGDQVVVDGTQGLVIVDPDADTLARYRERKSREERLGVVLAELRDQPAETTDGKLLSIEANIEVPGEVQAVLAHGADGIGLFRSEFLFLQPGRFPTEEEQYRAYSAVLTAMGERSVTIRTLDLGGDKVMPGFTLQVEANPLLGWRAVRFCLARPEVFRTQLRALLRASVHGALRIMFPLISGAAELDGILALLDQVREELAHEGVPFRGDIPVGIMIEVPSAAVTSDILAARADFFSIGTNDLIQYTMAVDRGNERVAYLYEPLAPAVLRLIRMTIDNAHARGIPVGMCGEMAGDPLATGVLLGLGLDSLSMGPIGIPAVKRIVRSVSSMDAESFVRSLATFASGPQIEQAVREWMGDLLDSPAG
jgi:phosphoenolpyruvate-protein phosphotransferase (PTS system enzyme I)